MVLYDVEAMAVCEVEMIASSSYYIISYCIIANIWLVEEEGDGLGALVALVLAVAGFLAAGCYLVLSWVAVAA